MHVLADTWAHTYFAGTPSLVINNTNYEFYEMFPEGDGYSEKRVTFRHKTSVPDDPENSIYTNSLYQRSENTIMNLGHGRAGHLPDYSYARYRYLPAWGEYEEIVKDNPSDYMKAFTQMIYAMKFIRGDIDTFETEKYDTQAVPEQVAENYKNLVYKLLGAKFKYHDEKELYLHFDSKAYGEFVDYYNNFIEPHLVTDMAFCKDWGGKYHGELLRLCGIIHCIKCALNDVNPVENRVTLDTFCNAIEIGEYFREQAIYAYSLGDVDLGTIKAERVLNKIRSKHIQQIRQNDLYKLCRCTLFKNAADFAETMEMLEEYNYLRRETIQGANGNNKSGIMVFINPHI